MERQTWFCGCWMLLTDLTGNRWYNIWCGDIMLRPGEKNKKNMSGNWEFYNFNHVQLYSSSRLGGCQLVDVWADKPPVLNGKCHRSSSVNARLARSFTANWRWTQPHHGMCWTQRHPSAGPRASAIRSRWGSERKTQYLRRKWPQKNKSNSHHITSYNNPPKKIGMCFKDIVDDSSLNFHVDIFVCFFGGFLSSVQNFSQVI